MLTFKIKLNNFGSLFCAESFHLKFSKFFEENSKKEKQKENVKKFIRLLNHNVTYAPPYSIASNAFLSLLQYFDVESPEVEITIREKHVTKNSMTTTSVFVFFCSCGYVKRKM